MLRNGKLKIHIKKPDIDTKLLMLWFLELYSLTIVRYILSSVGVFGGTLRTIVLWGVAFVPIISFLFNIRKIDPRKYSGFIILFAVVIISMLFSIMLNPSLGEYFTRANYGLERILRPDCAIYAFLFIGLFEDTSKLKKNVKAIAYLDFIYRVIFQLVPALSRGYWVDIGPQGQELHFSYSLSFGYAIAFPTIVFAYFFAKERKPIHLAVALVGFWCVLTQGNRGALLVLVIYAGLFVISNIVGSPNATKKALKISGIIIALIIVAVFSDTILNYLYEALKSSGISSRNIEKLLNGSFADDNGRDLIWLTVWNAIRTGGIFGHGMLGDRPYVSPIHTAGYSHNLFLELLCSYGVIGVIIILIIAIDVIRMIFFCKDDDWRELYIILFSISCQLMLSMSFWYVWEFWAAAAVAYRYRKLYGKNGYLKKSQFEI